MERSTKELSGVMEVFCILVKLQVLQECIHFSKVMVYKLLCVRKNFNYKVRSKYLYTR